MGLACVRLENRRGNIQRFRRTMDIQGSCCRRTKSLGELGRGDESESKRIQTRVDEKNLNAALQKIAP